MPRKYPGRGERTEKHNRQKMMADTLRRKKPKKYGGSNQGGGSIGGGSAGG